MRGLSSHFVWTNRGKQSLTLDVKQPQARRVLDALVAQADVLVQNLAPGAAARLGLSYEALAPRHPRLVVCDISGYGSDGPYRDKKAYDLLIQSESGFLSVTGTEAEPAKAGCSIADIAAGVQAHANILAALIERGRSGRGRHIEIAMLDSMVEWMGFPMYYAFDGAGPPPRAGASHATIQPYGPFTASDGKTVMLGVQNEREWAVFCRDVLHRPELAGDERFTSNSKRVAHRDALHAIIAEAFATLGASEVIARLDAAQIANAGVSDMHDVWSHPQLAARQRWRDIDTPAGRVPALLPPGRDDAPMGAVPALGSHTDVILAELGYASNDIEALRASGVI